MDFNKVVEYYEEISSTTKRLEIIEILASLFRECQKEENQKDLRKIVYLTQGQLTSDIDDFPEFGIAEKMVIQALVKFTAKSPSEIKKIINKTGDVGEAVQVILELRKKKKISYSLDAFGVASKKTKKQLEVSFLYEELKKLALTKGERSQERKIAILNGLLRLCKPATAKYLINIVLSNLRIGLADMTIIDALSVAFTGSKEQRDIIEHAYNIYPDLGKIAEILLKEGLEGIQKIRITVGIPIRMMLASRLPYKQIHAKLGGGEFVAEYKYDGERVQVHKNGNKIVLFSRRLKKITDQYPDVVETVKTHIKVEQAIFEGEIVAMDPFFEKMLPFQVMSSRRRKYDIKEMIEKVPVCLFCFDLLFLGYYKNPSETSQEESQDASPKSLIQEEVYKKPLLERRKKLEQIIKEDERIRLAHQKILHSTEEMIEYFHEARSAGAEGIMNKAIGPHSIYRPGNRGFLWIKLKGLEGAKMLDSIDVVIIGASWGKGRRKGLLSTFFGAVYNAEEDVFEFFTRIGSGFSDEDLYKFTELFKDLVIPKPPKNVLCKDTPDLWVKPKIIMEIIGDELTISNKSNAGATLDDSNGYSLRFPVFQRIRSDKSIKEITTTQEIIDLYRMQGKNE